MTRVSHTPFITMPRFENKTQIAHTERKNSTQGDKKIKSARIKSFTALPAGQDFAARRDLSG